jgi:4-alpha-glucanotransferase
LTDGEISSPPVSSASYVDFSTVISYKEKLFDRAFDRFRARNPGREYEDFCSRNAPWLQDYCRFVAIQSHFGRKVWADWPPEVRDRGPEALKELDRELSLLLEKEKFLQYTFFRQWSSLKNYCNQRGIRIIGDLPIYVNYDSADVWVYPEIFKLDADKKPFVVSGVPPDYFSETGQLWGNPIYRWDVLRRTGFDWWVRRMEQNGRLCDVLRIDHFIGLSAYWEIPAQEKTAIFAAMFDHLIPGRWNETRQPSADELRKTLVVGFDVEEASAKIRAGGPLDDEEDMALPCWAGVLPLRLTACAPIAEPGLAPGLPLPTAVRHWGGLVATVAVEPAG